MAATPATVTANVAPTFPLVVSSGSSAIVPADSAVTFPHTITSGSNDEFVWTPATTGIPETFTISNATYTDITTLYQACNHAVGSTSGNQFDTYAGIFGIWATNQLYVTDTFNYGAGNGDKLSYGSHNGAAGIGFTGNPDTLSGGTDPNDQFVYTPIATGVPEAFTVAGGTYSTLVALEAAVDTAVGASSENFDTIATASGSGSKLVLTEVVPGAAHNGDTISFGSPDIAADLGFTSNPNTFSGGVGADPDFQNFGLKIEVAFGDSVWATSPTWTDITRYVRSFTTSLGRQHELQQVNPSTAVIQLANEPVGTADPGGRFSSWNTDSPYYNSGNGLTPGHPVQITASVSGTPYNIFYGYTQSWVPAYGQSRSTVTLNCYDALALLNLAMLDGSQYESQILSDGAVAFWECQDRPLSTTFADSTGNGNTATLYGYGAFGGTGALKIQGDSCCGFSGAGLMQTPITPGSFSHVMFEGWFQGTGVKEPLMSWTNGTVFGFMFGVTLQASGLGNAELIFGGFNGGTTLHTMATGPTVNDGNWHYYAVEVPITDATSTWTLYVDGVLVGSGSAGAGTADWATYEFVTAGWWLTYNGGGAYLGAAFTGNQDQVAYYTTPLTAAQIANHYELGTAGFAVEDSGSRVQAVLESAGVPSGLINCDTGYVQVAGATSSLNQTTVMSYLQTVVNTERGFLYQDTSGVIQFKNRHYVYTNSTSLTPQVTFSYHTGSTQHFLASGFVPQEDDSDLWNDILVAMQGGVPQQADNAFSIALFGRRTLQGYTSLLFTNSNDAYDLASGLLYQYDAPKPRVRSITLSSTVNGGSTLPYMFGLDPLDLVEIVWKPIDGSSVDFSQGSLIEQITHTVVPGQWTTTFAVTPIGTEQFFIVGSATEGLIGSSLLGF